MTETPRSPRLRAPSYYLAPLAEIVLPPVGVSEVICWRLQLLFDTSLALGNFPHCLLRRELRKKWMRDRMAAEVDSLRFHQPDLIPRQHFVLALVIRHRQLPESLSQELFALAICPAPQQLEEFVVGSQPFFSVTHPEAPWYHQV